MTFRITYWDTLDDNLECKKKIFLSIPLASVICLHFNMQEKDILKHMSGKSHLCTL
jgi:hypothetical protein